MAEIFEATNQVRSNEQDAHFRVPYDYPVISGRQKVFSCDKLCYYLEKSTFCFLNITTTPASLSRDNGIKDIIARVCLNAKKGLRLQFIYQGNECFFFTNRTGILHQ